MASEAMRGGQTAAHPWPSVLRISNSFSTSNDFRKPRDMTKTNMRIDESEEM